MLLGGKQPSPYDFNDPFDTDLSGEFHGKEKGQGGKGKERYGEERKCEERQRKERKGTEKIGMGRKCNFPGNPPVTFQGGVARSRLLAARFPGS